MQPPGSFRAAVFVFPVPFLNWSVFLMTQTQLDRAVARATGDDVATIQAHGFSLVDPADGELAQPDDGLIEKFLDWDALAERANRRPSAVA